MTFPWNWTSYLRTPSLPQKP